MLPAAEAEAARLAKEEADRLAFREHIGTGQRSQPNTDPNEVRITGKATMERPEGVDGKTWFNANHSERARLIAESNQRAADAAAFDSYLEGFYASLKPGGIRDEIDDWGLGASPEPAMTEADPLAVGYAPVPAYDPTKPAWAQSQLMPTHIPQRGPDRRFATGVYDSRSGGRYAGSFVEPEAPIAGAAPEGHIDHSPFAAWVEPVPAAVPGRQHDDSGSFADGKRLRSAPVSGAASTEEVEPSGGERPSRFSEAEWDAMEARWAAEAKARESARDTEAVAGNRHARWTRFIEGVQRMKRGDKIRAGIAAVAIPVVAGLAWGSWNAPHAAAEGSGRAGTVAEASVTPSPSDGSSPSTQGPSSTTPNPGNGPEQGHGQPNVLAQPHGTVRLDQGGGNIWNIAENHLTAMAGGKRPTSTEILGETVRIMRLNGITNNHTNDPNDAHHIYGDREIHF